MKKYFSLFLFLHCTLYVLGQGLLDQVSYLNKTFDDKPLTEEKINEFTQFLKRTIEQAEVCETDKCRMEKYHKIASIHYVLDAPKDTVALYLNKCREASFELSCRMLTKFNAVRGNGKGNQKFTGRAYFAREFSSDWWNDFERECGPFMETYLASKVKKDVLEKPIQLPAFAACLKEIKKKDQKYRVGIQQKEFDQALMDKQYVLDVRNRTLLDSLYAIYGFPTEKKVGVKGVENVWYVLQHSTDCDWNEQWVERFIQHDIKDEIHEPKLLFTISRFYDPEKGYCPEEKRKYFIKYLKANYPERIAEKFKYKGFYE